MEFDSSPSEARQPHSSHRDPLHDPDRLAALRETGLLGSDGEEAFDRLTRLAAQFLRAPISLVTLVAGDRQFFKSAVGLSEPWASRREMPLEYSYCRYALGSMEPLLIEDARKDPRLQDSPAVTENGSIAYAGVPLATETGQVLGTLCVVDQEPRAWTDGEVSILKDLAASVMAEITLRREIQDRRQTEEALRQQAALLDLAHDCVLVRGLDSTVRFWNASAERVYGWSREEVLGQKSHVLLHTEFPRPSEEIEREVLRDGLWEGELAHTTREGARILVESRWALQRDESGAPQVILELNRDITARKAAEERVRRKNMLLQLLHTTAVAANASESLDEAIAQVIEYVCAHPDLSIGHAFVVDEESGDLVSSRLWAGADPNRFEAFRRASEATRLARGAGVPGRVLATAEPVWIPELAEEPTFTRAQPAHSAGLHTGIAVPVRVGEEVVAVLEFFSERALPHDGPLLSALDSVGIQLGRVVEHRRAAEAQIRAREAAESASRAKSDFLSRMSHELRTPMNAILGFAQLLEMDLLGTEQRDSVEQILRGGRHLLVLINEVLDIASIEAGRLPLSPEPVHVGEVLDEVLSLVWPLAKDRRVSLPQVPELCDQHVQADRQRLKQVFLNLFSNGIKYNRMDGRVSVSCAEVDGSRLRISVTDTGPGIPPERRERLFQPFERLGVEQTGQEEGTGLGLVLSRALVEAMGGRIDVESEPGQGSTFWVELPMTQVTTDGVESEPPSPATGATEGPQDVRTVLSIEDNLSNVKLIQRVLSHRADVELIPAMQGSLGLDLAAEHRPDLILLDLNLPDLRGEEVLLRLRADERTAAIPVVVLSADATPGQVRRLLDTGVRAYLTKPIDVKQFLSIVDEVLAEARQ